MASESAIRELPWRTTPGQVLLAWPAREPVVMLHSAGRNERWARWSILARPRAYWRFQHGRSRLIDFRANDVDPALLPGSIDFRHDPLGDLDALLAAGRGAAGPHAGVPFVGGWIGYLSYDLGRLVEPVARHEHPAADDRCWPLMELAYCPGALLYDHARRRWLQVGPSGAPPEPAGPVRDATPPAVGSLTPAISPDEYGRLVERTLHLIGAGDIFQANITQRFSAPFDGSTRALAERALARSGAWYGAYLELPEARCIISLSPELFLQVDAATRRVTTRPIKGTSPSVTDPAMLLASSKDAAELTMIVDLMRNDLGRVCTPGTIRVPHPRVIETHAEVHHGVGEVTGRLRDDVSAGRLISATFPGGSVTGAPKIRAMQVIDELEPTRRGPYCGSIGCFSHDGGASLNIAIRTLLLAGQRDDDAVDRMRGVLDYSAGGGIVADSDPRLEYRECLDKTAVLRHVLRQHTAPPLAVAPGP